jgi:hypothetical protein
MFSQYTLLIKWIAAALIAAAISAAVYAGYAHIKQIGFEEGKTETTQFYEAKIKESNDKLDQHIHVLEKLSTTIVDNHKEFTVKLDNDIKGVLLTVKGMTPYVVVDGKCAPSPAFVDAYNKMIKRANE